MRAKKNLTVSDLMLEQQALEQQPDGDVPSQPGIDRVTLSFKGLDICIEARNPQTVSSFCGELPKVMLAAFDTMPKLKPSEPPQVTKPRGTAVSLNMTMAESMALHVLFRQLNDWHLTERGLSAAHVRLVRKIDGMLGSELGGAVEALPELPTKGGKEVK